MRVCWKMPQYGTVCFPVDKFAVSMELAKQRSSSSIENSSIMHRLGWSYNPESRQAVCYTACIFGLLFGLTVTQIDAIKHLVLKGGIHESGYTRGHPRVSVLIDRVRPEPICHPFPVTPAHTPLSLMNLLFDSVKCPSKDEGCSSTVSCIIIIRGLAQ